MSGQGRRHIVVDRERCIGSGNCCFLKSVVVDPAGDDPADVRAAVEGCPVTAISVHDDGGHRREEAE
jgi:ferredoxin